MRACWVVLQTVGRRVGGRIIEKRTYAGGLIKYADSATHYQITFFVRLICKAKSGRDVVPVRRIDGIDAGALDGKALVGDKDREVLIAAMQRSSVFVSQAEIHVQLARYLPGILPEESERVDCDLSFRVSYIDGGGAHIASHEVR